MMKTGMLWFDNDPHTDLAVKISLRADYYQKKYGCSLTCVMCIPAWCSPNWSKPPASRSAQSNGFAQPFMVGRFVSLSVIDLVER